MANGLAVVSIDIPTVSSAKIASYLNFYKEQTPENIAKAILEAKLDNDNQAVVTKLANQFKSDLSNLVRQVQNIK